MKAVLASVKPKHCYNIANLLKTLELRKNEPNLKVPFKVYIYCTKGKDNLYNVDNRIVLNNYKVTFDTNGNALETIYQLNGTVIGEFVCDKIYYLDADSVGFVVKKNGKYVYLSECAELNTCVSEKEMRKYFGIYRGFAWHISNLIIYNEPKELREFTKYNRHCEFDYMPFARPDDCSHCVGCKLEKPPQSWCYVEELPEKETYSAF